MKTIIIITVITASAIISINYVNRIRQHTKAVSQLCLMIENIEIILHQHNIDTEEIFKNLSMNNNYNLLTFIKPIYENMSFDKNILSKSNRLYIKNNKYFNEEEKELIINFLSLLGKSDLNGQLMNCKTYKEILKKRLKENEAKELTECKNSSILVFGIGFLIVILII